MRARVLVVEDNEDTREMFVWCMRAAGWMVEVATNGAEALLRVSAFRPHVIVMDLAMPVLGGIEAIRALKKDEETRRIPIVACTAFDPVASEAMARAAGCEAFVPKPCDPDDLCRVAEAVIAERAAGE